MRNQVLNFRNQLEILSSIMQANLHPLAPVCLCELVFGMFSSVGGTLSQLLVNCCAKIYGNSYRKPMAEELG